jgi:iron complex transport system substrate-binding protein
MFKLTPTVKKSLIGATALSLLALSQSVLAAAPRVISAGAGITELVLALDAGNELVAVDSTSQLPEKHSDVAKLGYHRMLSAEGILALSPNLVLGSDAMGPKSTLDLLKNAKIKVVQLPDSDSQTQLLSNINEMGELLQRQSQAEKLQHKINQSFATIAIKRQRIAEQKEVPKVLFLLLQADRPARVGGDDTAADIIIKLAGGKNIAGFPGYKSVSQEGILSMQPDVILLSNRSDNESNDVVDTLIKQMPLIEHTPAGQHKQIKYLKPQALLGGLGLSAIEAADNLADSLIKINRP